MPEETNLTTPIRRVSDAFSENERIVLTPGDCFPTLQAIPSETINLVVTSPPYNMNKEYEVEATLDSYLKTLGPILEELKRVLHPSGSICWQVGNYVKDGEVFPLDIYYYHLFKELGFKLRNRMIWHFGHGLHAKKRFSGRYETLLWFTKSDNYKFQLDPVRVPSKYPGKRHFRGKKVGQPSGNPKGKNPSDVWEVLAEDWENELWNIPNVKARHKEQTIHPCQFPIALAERCVLALTSEDDWVLDPFAGVGSTLLAALKNNRRVIGCEKEEEYNAVTLQRISDHYAGKLRYRPLTQSVYVPNKRDKVAQTPVEWLNAE